MNREFKFRVWDNDQLEFYYFDLLNVPLIVAFSAPVTQYTGQKDKNGVEIYDGDILTITLYDNEWKTTVRDYYGTLVIDVEDCDWNTTALSFLDDEAETEVIGNIYENPELLTTI